jgi:ring-1,2-phenylacetyl-CoA epoxidase subunit PaaE
MAHSFHTLRVKQKIQETPECVSLVFDVPEDLQEVFLFKEGQNITIKKTLDNVELRRSYSICASPSEKQLKVAIKKVEGGVFSTYANDILLANEELEIMPPSGKFSAHLENTIAPNYIAIAAGSGITPIISIIKHTLQQQTNATFTLVYGSKNRPAIIFFEELEGLKNKYMERFSLINILSRERTDTDLFYGRIDENKLTLLSKIIDYKSFDQAYLCGPEKMIFTAIDFLEKNGMSKKNIHFELFATSNQFYASPISTTNNTNEELGPKSNIILRLDGRQLSFDLSFNGQTILDAALQQGADLPYACKGGVCCTCKAKLLEGNVTMDVNYALEEEEVAQGYILTCQSHPTTEKVVVDFDIK